MRFHRESNATRYDVVVIGAGVGGLSAAAKLANDGQRVLVVERHDRPGGYAHAFKRKRYQFDSAVHLIGGGGDGLIGRMLRELDVEERCELLRVDPFYTGIFPGFRIDAPLGARDFLAAHSDAFPGEKEGLQTWFESCRAIRDETDRATALGAASGSSAIGTVIEHARDFPMLVRHRRSTLSDVLDAHIEDDRAKAVLATLWPYLGLPPSKLSFHYFAMMLMSYVEGGAWYCRGSFQKLADALVYAIKRDGGEVLLKSTVRRIRIEGGRVAGVLLENGQSIDARAVISGADALQTFEELVGYQHLPVGTPESLETLEPSLSAFIVYGATTLDLRAAGAGHEMFIYDTWDHDEDYASALAGETRRIGFTVPTLADPSLGPDGEDLFMITVLLPHTLVRSWRDEKELRCNRLIDIADAAFPGLREHLTFVEAATPRTLERYTRNSGGAMYGWSAAPGQVGPSRLPPATSIDGLHLAGHWTQPGPGVYGAIASGLAAARAISER